MEHWENGSDTHRLIDSLTHRAKYRRPAQYGASLENTGRKSRNIIIALTDWSRSISHHSENYSTSGIHRYSSASSVGPNTIGTFTLSHPFNLPLNVASLPSVLNIIGNLFHHVVACCLHDAHVINFLPGIVYHLLSCIPVMFARRILSHSFLMIFLSKSCE